MATRSFNSIGEFLSIRGHGLHWMVLRNFDRIPTDIAEFDDDFDILCNDLDLCVEVLNLEKRAWGLASYYTVICGVKVPVDVRFPGDGYYDKSWSIELLRTAILHKIGCFVPNPESHFYSYAYHVLVHKLQITDSHVHKLVELETEIEASIDVENVAELTGSVINYMKKNIYMFERPIDSCITLNKKMAALIAAETSIKHVECVPFKIKIGRLMPFWLLVTVSKLFRLIRGK